MGTCRERLNNISTILIRYLMESLTDFISDVIWRKPVSFPNVKMHIITWYSTSFSLMTKGSRAVSERSTLLGEVGRPLEEPLPPLQDLDKGWFCAKHIDDLVQGCDISSVLVMENLEKKQCNYLMMLSHIIWSVFLFDSLNKWPFLGMQNCFSALVQDYHHANF